jgi:hypothetical protein
LSKLNVNFLESQNQLRINRVKIISYYIIKIKEN